MRPEVLKRIFDPFFTTKQRGKGTGMGLAVVHGIVENCGGLILSHSEPGKGSVFKVYLPVAESTPLPDKVAATQLPVGGESILLVDDEPPLVEVGTKILENLGYGVVAMTNPMDALDRFRAQPHDFDLVITDKTMPNMTGDKLIQELSTIRNGIPVILCTGFNSGITEENAEKMGVNGLLMKPYVQSELAQLVRKVLDKSTSISPFQMD
jgi:CheY-like chemotaxis protein